MFRCLLLACLAFHAVAAETIQEYVVRHSYDDAQEDVFVGYVFVNSAELEFGHQDGTQFEFMVGMRFTEIEIPPSSYVTKSYITVFGLPNTNGDDILLEGDLSLNIAVELNPHAKAFTDTDGDLSVRNTTLTELHLASEWTPDVGNFQSGQAYNTSDLSHVINHVISRPSWNSTGLSLVFIFSLLSGTERMCMSFDTPGGMPPQLHLHFVPCNATLCVPPPVPCNSTLCAPPVRTHDGSAESLRTLQFILISAGAVLGLVLIGLVIWCMVRHRHESSDYREIADADRDADDMLGAEANLPTLSKERGFVASFATRVTKEKLDEFFAKLHTLKDVRMYRLLLSDYVNPSKLSQPGAKHAKQFAQMCHDDNAQRWLFPIFDCANQAVIEDAMNVLVTCHVEQFLKGNGPSTGLQTSIEFMKSGKAYPWTEELIGVCRMLVSNYLRAVLNTWNGDTNSDGGRVFDALLMASRAVETFIFCSPELFGMGANTVQKLGFHTDADGFTDDSLVTSLLSVLDKAGRRSTAQATPNSPAAAMKRRLAAEIEYFSAIHQYFLEVSSYVYAMANAKNNNVSGNSGERANIMASVAANLAQLMRDQPGRADWVYAGLDAEAVGGSASAARMSTASTMSTHTAMTPKSPTSNASNASSKDKGDEKAPRAWVPQYDKTETIMLLNKAPELILEKRRQRRGLLGLNDDAMAGTGGLQIGSPIDVFARMRVDSRIRGFSGMIDPNEGKRNKGAYDMLAAPSTAWTTAQATPAHLTSMAGLELRTLEVVGAMNNAPGGLAAASEHPMPVPALQRLMSTVISVKPQSTWPVLDFLQTQPKYPIVGETYRQLLPYHHLVDLMPGTNAPAICSTDGRQPLTHQRLRIFVQSLNLCQYGIVPNMRIGILLPNGSELSVCVFSVAAHACCVPVNPQGTGPEIKAELEDVHAKAIIVMAGQANDHLIQVAKEMQVPVLVLTPSSTECGIFALEPMMGAGLASPVPAHPVDAAFLDGDETNVPGGVRNGFSKPEHHSLVLHTSGTSGKKKVVPYTLETMVIGAACVIQSWQLTPDDVDLNMMPLFHIGGIMRNLFAVVLSGGSVICAAGFDASLFWDIVGLGKVTWYYAGPTLHQLIVEEGKSRNMFSKSKIRMIANAAGGLLPSLAQDMSSNFRCTILPGYGMTECMPISAPPVDYRLDRPGTSGRPTGPEVAILDDEGKEVTAKTVGNICVRGCPLFHGYEADEKATAKAFFPGGWFNTGDMGYMDADKYLYLTGRSKEVINRGGEIISPFEIEEAITVCPRVKRVMCFSAAHDLLQETVGVVIVPKPGEPRIDLNGILKFVNTSLHPSKWPAVVVYMTDLPVNDTNKPLRINFGPRMNPPIPELNDNMPQLQRLYEADCPPKGTSLQVKINCRPVTVTFDDAMNIIRSKPALTDCFIMQRKVLRVADAVVAYVTPTGPATDKAIAELKIELASKVHDYMCPVAIVPVDFIPRNANGVVDTSALPSPSSGEENKEFEKSTNQLEEKIEKIWQNLLNYTDPISATADFWELGGSSLLAGKLASAIRMAFKAPVSVAALFNNRTIRAMAGLVSKNLTDSSLQGPSENKDGDGGGNAGGGNGGGMQKGPFVLTDTLMPRSPTSPLVLFVQALPLVVIRPLRWYCFFLVFCTLISTWEKNHDVPRIVSFLGAAITARFIVLIVFPFVGILFKWIIIGKYEAGRHRLWGTYYLRWWLCKQVVAICGAGAFHWYPSFIPMYHRLMGATIGPGTKMSGKCEFGEWDLITIGANCSLDAGIYRPFCMEEGTMVFKAITIGNNVSTCCKTVIAPGALVPDGTALPPLSSSYELEGANEEWRKFSRPGFKSPDMYVKICFGYPILLVAKLLSLLPWFAVFEFLIHEPFFHTYRLSSFVRVIYWFTRPERIGFYFFLRATWRIFVPIMKLIVGIVFKWIFVGKFKPGKRDPFQFWLMSSLLPGSEVAHVMGLFGRHYDTTSFVFRLLGAKIGKRVYWPGSGLDIVAYDLLEIGDDVVFGSRTVVMPCDANFSAPVRIGNSTNIADRCVLLPGCTVEDCTVMGSGTLGCAATTYEIGSIWVGNQKGKPEQLGQADPTRKAEVMPFGRAFHLRLAPYYVMREWMYVSLHLVWNAIIAGYHGLPLILAMLLAVYAQDVYTIDTSRTEQSFNNAVLMGWVLLFYVIIWTPSCIGALLIVMGGKWMIIGRRKPGEYSWDKNSYCQRWQMSLMVEEIGRRSLFHTGKILDFFHGSQYLVWYFRAMGATIGHRVCLYPNGADPMMTEPDLVTIADGACVDNASLVCHLNTKGFFTLNSLKVGGGATLRSFTRLLSGGEMEPGSTLLEHTLILSGDVVPEGTIWQGWPSQQVGRTLEKLRNFMSATAGVGVWRVMDLEGQVAKLLAEKQALEKEKLELRNQKMKLVKKLKIAQNSGGGDDLGEPLL